MSNCWSFGEKSLNEEEISSLFGKNESLVIIDYMNFLTLAHTGNQRQSRIIVSSLLRMTQKSINMDPSIHHAVREVEQS
jgi:hypothetical protein